MLQHFEAVRIGIPQPKFAIGSRVEVVRKSRVKYVRNWGVITGIQFNNLNTHPECEHRGWDYQVTFDSDSPSWFIDSGLSWYSEDEIEASLISAK